jgi:uncharacterized repeat protein (TIGR03803 family)
MKRRMKPGRLECLVCAAIVGAMGTPGGTSAQTLTTLVGFNGTDGQNPYGGLIADVNGNLFGVTGSGGAFGYGTVFEIVKTSGGYASTPTTLVSFNGADGNEPLAGLMADANGNLFGTTFSGGASGDGVVFEIAKTSGGYASTPTTLVSFDYADGQAPFAGLIADANGNLFGTTYRGGASGDGTVFEVAKTSGGYASTPTILVSFNGVDGSSPYAGLLADTDGNLFGTTQNGGVAGDGTVFEIVKTSGGYASTPTILVSFNGVDGSQPLAALIADANGNLFGTTYRGGASGDGTVFEIIRTSSGYASTSTTLVSFNFADGVGPAASLIADANGNLFGTTDTGAVFEIARTSAGYASTPTTLVSFYGANGASPAGLMADASGNLFGTTSGGGASGDGTVFEITGSGFATGTGGAITKLTASENPIAHGDNVTLTATVAPATATGSVTFYDGSTTLGTGVIAGGAASFLFGNPSVGTHLVTAAFEGYVSPPLMLVDVTEPVPNPPIPDPLTGNLLLNPGAESGTQDWWPPAPMSAVTAPGHTGSYSFQGVSVPGAFITQGVNLAQVTGITLAQVDSGNLSANYSFWFADLSPGSGSYGQVTLTFLDVNGTPLGQGLSGILEDPGTLTWSIGTGSFRIPPGTRRINYTMDFITANAANTGLIDDNVLTISSQASTITKLTSSENPAVHGDNITLTAAVFPSTATGIVTFYNSAITLGAVSLSHGVASLVLPNPSVGTYDITAAYSGDPADLSSVSTELTVVDLLPEMPVQASPTPLTSNLLLNPGAESGTSNWWPPAPGSAAVATAHTGSFSFQGTGAPGAFITQGVNLTQVAGITVNQVDSGSLAANYSFWFADLSPGSGTYGQVTLTFLDGNGIPLGEGLSARIRDVGSLSWSNGTGAFAIPPGTRTINYTMDFITPAQTNTGLIDDNLLTIGLVAP